MTLKIFKKYNIKAKKSLGQNFLVNEDILNKIASYKDISWKNIVEVWPWYWALSEKILEKNPKSLTLVELDKDMVEILKSRIYSWDLKTDSVDIEIKNEDVLKYSPEIKHYSVIANIPYYITSPILRHFLYDLDNAPSDMLILMQKDVWDKILWKWKNKSSVLSLFVAKKCYVEEVCFVWKENFIPSPKVESSVLYFKSHDLYKDVDDIKFLDLIKIGFSENRKKLVKNLTKILQKKEDILKIFEKLWFDENVRWEDLWIEEWIDLVKELD